MKRYTRIITVLLLVLGFVLVLAAITRGDNFQILNPKGTVAAQQMHLMVVVTLLMLVVVVPVFVLTFGIVWKYRDDNPTAKYAPKWDHNLLLESVWWGLPLLVIVIIGVLAWRSSHDLDPYKSLNSSVKPVTVEVVALQWKWLFIYPDQGVASVNYVQFPKGTPVNFYITADAPMNSFWIPQLGGQVYAMPGMATQLHLMADNAGDFAGSSANLSGTGFASMKFTAHASTQEDFDAWVASAKLSGQTLDSVQYATLARPSEGTPVQQYALGEDNLFHAAMMKFMSPSAITSYTNVQ
ncbi:MAG: ubiquinol oxidase subunit II [bacterium]